WERVQFIMEKEGFNKNSFSQAIGLSNNVTITRIINEKRNPSRSTCEKIIEHFPKYSFEWLFNGVGEPENKPRNYPHPLEALRASISSSGARLSRKVRKRLLEFLALKYVTLDEFLNHIGEDPHSWEEELDEDRENSRFIRKVRKYVPELNIDWLLKGEGGMFESSNIVAERAITYHTADVVPAGGQNNYRLIPLYSLDVVGGINNQEMDIMGYITGYMPFVNALPEDIAVVVTGNSMYPTFPAGCYVQIRKIEMWRHYIEFGQVHIIDLLDGRRLIKEIRKGRDDQHFKLISHNKDFDDTEVPIDFINAVWLVLAKYIKAVM
ncbi:MAG: XRE family transcriptional regulator, partial [Bacteroides sp.]|nr:XRE family transcriptional regulator [Bacteroides sp.]